MKISPKVKRENALLLFPLTRLTRLCVAYPIRVWVLGVALAVFCGYLSATQLKFKTSRLDLINQKSDFNKLWIDYIEDFGDEDDLVVVVEGPSQKIITPVLDELSTKIQAYPDLFSAVLHKVDTTPLLRKGLHFIEEERDLANIGQFSFQGAEIAAGHWEYLNATTFLGGLTRKLSLEGDPTGNVEESNLSLRETFRELDAFTNALADALSPQPTFKVNPLPPIDRMGTLNSEYFIADQGRMGVVLLKIVESKEGSFTYGTRSIEKLREIIRDCQERHPRTEIGLTGLTVMENDEMRISQEGSTKATFLSLVGVAFIFIVAFGGFRHPMIAVVALVIGLGWTMGYVVLSVGHLNILSMSFGVILIGLGIDFGIHYVSRYLEVRGRGVDPTSAILETSGKVGPGVLVGAVTTATAFLMVGLSEFTGIAELGIISAGGILLCCAAAIILIPPMIVLLDGREKKGEGTVGRFGGRRKDARREERGDRLGEDPEKPVKLMTVDPCRWIVPLLHYPRMTILISLVVTAYFATGLSHLWYDHNLLNMQPENLESVQLEKKLLTKWDKGAWFALSIADTPEELLERKKEFEKDPTLMVDEIVSRFPKSTPEKEEMIRQIRETLADLPEQPGPVPLTDSASLGAVLAQTRLLVEQVMGENFPEEERQRILRQLESIRQALRTLPADQFQQRIATFQQHLAGEFLGRLHLIRFSASPEQPDLNDLPESLVSRYVGQKSGKFLMRIYSTHEIWDMANLSDFIARVKKVDPNATGNPIQTYEASLQIQRSYRMASFYALLAILPILYFDFRSLKLTFLALVPMMVGIVWAFGLMGILGIPFNPANTIVIPLIFGIGIDDGVHVVHDFRAQRGRYHLTPSLTNAIFLTTLSTIIGFGSLMIADHRGLQSLGRVLVIGLASCTLVSLTLLPALLRWLTIHEEEETSSRFTGSRRLENELWGNDPIYHSPNRFSTPDFDGYPVRNRHPSRRD